jgi:hypothetical protein
MIAQFYGEKNTLIFVADLINTVYGQSPNVRLKKHKNEKFNCYVIEVGNDIAEHLVSKGAVVGKKVNETLRVPTWVMESGLRLKRMFVSIFWTTEGSSPLLTRHGKTSKMPVLSMAVATEKFTSDFFEELSKIMKELGVDTTIKFKERDSLDRIYQYIYVNSDIDNIIRFYDDIGYIYEEKKSDKAFKISCYLKAYRHSGNTKCKRYAEEIEKYGYKKGSERLGITISALKSTHYNCKKKKYKPRACNSFPTFIEWISSREEGRGVRLEIVGSTTSKHKVQMYNIGVDSYDHSYLLASGFDNFNSFTTLSNLVYSSFIYADNVIDEEINPRQHGAVHIGLDFNVAMVSAIASVKVADKLVLFDEIMLENSNTTEMALEIKRRYEGMHVYVYPDPSGRSRKTSAAIGVTDFTILEQQGFYVIAPKKHEAVQDRINTVNALLCNANGDKRLFVHKKCKNTIESLQGQVYDLARNAPDKKGGLDHMADALGYLCLSAAPMNQRVAKQKITGIM